MGKRKLKPLSETIKIREDIESLKKYLGDIRNIQIYSDFPEKNDNPFLCNLNSMLGYGFEKGGNLFGIARAEMFDPITGEGMPLEAPIRFSKAKVLPKELFVKVYSNSLKDMFQLSHTALQVYGYFISEMMGKKDITEIYFRLQDCMEFCNYKARSTVYDGLTELIREGFIAKTTRPPSFFINPKNAFNGDLVETNNRYILAGSNAEKEMNNQLTGNNKPELPEFNLKVIKHEWDNV